MSERERPSARTYGVLAFPVGMLVIFFLIPFGIMVATSFYHRIEGAFYEPAFELANWQRLFQPVFLERALFSIGICLLAGFVCIVVAFPFTYFLTRMRRRPQVALLIVVLSALSLSEVIVAFSWYILLGRASGVSNILVWLGVMNEAAAYQPSFAAVLLGLCYIAFPYCVLTLVPAAHASRSRDHRGGADARGLAVAHVLDRRRPDRPSDHRRRVPARVRLHARELHHRLLPRASRALDALGLHRGPGVGERERAVRGGDGDLPDRRCRSSWWRWSDSSSPGRGC